MELVDLTPGVRDANVLLYWKLETMGDAVVHQLVLDVYEQVDDLLRPELGDWSLL